MEAIRKPRNQWPAFGTLLVRDGAVTAEQLEQRARGAARARPDRRLGEILLEKGFVDPDARSRASSPSSTSSSSSSSTSSRSTSTAALLLPESLARRYRALPIRFLDDGYVLVAVADPTNVMFSDELRLAVGMPIRICVAAPETIEAAITTLNDAAAGPDRGVRQRRPGDARTPRAFSTSTTTRRPSSSSTGRSRTRSTSAPPTSTSPRSSAGSTCASGSTASCAS